MLRQKHARKTMRQVYTSWLSNNEARIVDKWVQVASGLSQQKLESILGPLFFTDFSSPSTMNWPLIGQDDVL